MLSASSGQFKKGFNQADLLFATDLNQWHFERSNNMVSFQPCCLNTCEGEELQSPMNDERFHDP
jgi:hypothetical protein